jgi:hypothetical protein
MTKELVDALKDAHEHTKVRGESLYDSDCPTCDLILRAEASEKEGVGRVKCDCDRKCDRDAVVSFVDDIEGVTVPTCAIHAKAYRRNTDTWKETALRTATTVQQIGRYTDEEVREIERESQRLGSGLFVPGVSDQPTAQGYSREEVREALTRLASDILSNDWPIREIERMVEPYLIIGGEKP